MSSEGMSMNVRIRLSLMMFLQFMLFAVFWVPLAGYMSNTLSLTVGQVTWIMSTMAFGCMLSPIIGMIADRHFASQKVLAVLNLMGGIFLIVASMQKDANTMFTALLLQQLCYMPTWGLTSAIAMSNSPSDKFPQIRAFGSFGWVAAAIFSIGAKYIFKIEGFDGGNLPLLCGAGVSFVAAALALTVPNTPPPAKGQKSSIIDVLGLKASVLLKQVDFLVFMIISMLVMTPFMIYFNLNSMFLNDQGFEFITLTMNLGQFGEIFFMLLITLVLKRIGVKWAMVIGLATMALRYGAFWLGSAQEITAMYYVAIIIHGIIFGFFFVGGQIYVDRKAPSEIRAQAQGFLFLITFGLGTLISMQVNNRLIAEYTSEGISVSETVVIPDAATVGKDMLTVKDAKLEDVRLYDRVLNDTEISVLAANEKKANNIREEAKAKNISVELEKNLIAKGTLSDIADQKIGQSFTFDANLTLPAETELEGNIFTTGAGDNALTIGIENNKLYFQAGKEKVVARRIALPKGDSIRLTGSFNGEQFVLHTNATKYVMRDWTPIWKITTVSSVILLIAFAALFHYKEEEDEDKPAEATA